MPDRSNARRQLKPAPNRTARAGSGNRRASRRCAIASKAHRRGIDPSQGKRQTGFRMGRHGHVPSQGPEPVPGCACWAMGPDSGAQCRLDAVSNQTQGHNAAALTRSPKGVGDREEAALLPVCKCIAFECRWPSPLARFCSDFCDATVHPHAGRAALWPRGLVPVGLPSGRLAEETLACSADES